MKQFTVTRGTTLFTIRLWPVKRDEGEREWWGKLCHVESGEQHYFRTWPEMLALLQAMLPVEE